VIALIPATVAANDPRAPIEDVLALPIAMSDAYGQNLDRGVIAAEVSNGVFISWRFFPEEATGFDNDNKRLTGTDFYVYKNGAFLAEVTNSTNFIDPDGSNADTYVLVTVANGKGISRSNEFKPAPLLTEGFTDGRPGAEIAAYVEFPVFMPPDSVMPSDTTIGQTTTWPYFIDKMSAGDIDGDGQIDIVLRLKGRAPDTTQNGFIPPIIHQGYKLGWAEDGSLTATILWEIDLGINIRGGQHYSQPMLYNFDGGVSSQLMVVTAPGTRWRSFENGEYIDFNDADSWTFIDMPEDDYHRMWDIEKKEWKYEF